MLNNVSNVCLLVYAILLLLWSILLISGGKTYGDFVEPLDRKKYLLKDLYPSGLKFLELIRYSYATAADENRLQQARIIYGEKYGEYYFRINMAEKFTYALLCIVVSPLIGAFVGNAILCLFGLFAAGVTFYYADSKIGDIVKLREEEITKDFSDMVSKMALLINAGMITREAWEDISKTGKGTLYDEMRTSVENMNNGMSEMDAYIIFGNRCNVPYVKKFISMLVQNLSKGNKELVGFLTKETITSWEEKKHIVRRQGEAASSKLMLPLGMILVGIFIMILVPIVSSMGF